MNINYQARIAKLLDHTGVDVVAIVPGANMLYFTGLHFHLSERPTIALVSRDGLSFIIPSLEVTKLDQRPDLGARAFGWSDADGYTTSLKTMVSELGLSNKTLGVDGMTMRVFEWLALEQAGINVAKTKDVGQELMQVRSYKTAEEIAFLREAIQVSEKALQRTIESVKAGQTELEIARRLGDEMSALGSQGFAFGSIVLAGEKSALPHGGTGDRKIQQGEFLLFDFGGLKEDYPADITRTFCLGEPSDEMRKIYNAVLQANLAAQKIAAPGVSCHDVDKAARDVIEAAGYGQYFTHRLGHGLGLSGHELPNIAPNNPTILEVGMVFTIEPGIYVPHIGGVRIEDDVVVTETGIESLTTFPRELTIL